MNLSQIDLWIVGAYFLVTIIVGIIYGRKIGDMKTFAIGSRSFGTVAVTASICATVIGGGSTLNLSQRVFQFGFAYAFVSCGMALCHMWMGWLVVPRMGPCLKDAISSGDVMGHFYGKPGKVITGLGAALFCSALVATQVKVLGHIFEVFLELPAIWGVFLGCGIVVFYSAFGGIGAVTATDVLQFGLLAVALPLLCISGLWSLGGYSEFKTALAGSVDKLNFIPTGELASHQWLIFLIFFVNQIEPAVLQRFLMAGDSKKAAKAFFTSGIINFFVYTIVGVIGLIALAKSPHIDPNLTMPHLIRDLTPVGITGLCIAALFAIVMSSADSILHVASVCFTHDVIKPFAENWLGESKRELRLAQIFSMILGVASVGIALHFSDELSIVISFLNFWTPIVFIPLMSGIFGFRASPRTFMISSAASVVSFLVFESVITPLLNVNGYFPTLLINLIVFFTARLFDPLHIRIEKKEDGTTVVEAGRESVSARLSIAREPSQFGGHWNCTLPSRSL